MAKNVSVDTKSTQGKEKNINEEKNKEYEAMCERVNMFKVYEHLNAYNADEEDEEDDDEEEAEDEENTEHRNEMYFFLEEHPEYRISAVGRWLENSNGEVVGDADTYFLHITSGQRCEGVRDCFSGWSEQDEHATEIWETLCQRIEELDGLEQIICDEESFGL